MADKNNFSILRYANGISQDAFNEQNDIPSIDWVEKRLREQAIQATNLLDTSVNSSAAGYQFVSFNTAPEIETIPGKFVLYNDGIEVLEQGVYLAYASFYLESTIKETSPGFSLTVNGVANAKISASAYITAKSGNEETSTDLMQLISLSPGDKLGCVFYQLSAVGTVSTPAGRSILLLKRIF